jgi:hypothetical protein
MDDGEFSRILAHMREKSRRIEGRRLLREARQRSVEIREQIDGVRIAPGLVMARVDQRFDSTLTFQPSTMIRTQLRLAIHYVQAADEGGFPVGKSQPPTLSSFVVLRAAIECTASAHWLLSGKNHRQSVERVLKRMWWDTDSAAEMATIADGAADRRVLLDLEERITRISGPIKGLDSAKIVDSKRIPLSTIVSDAGAALRPNYPTMMRAGWMLCSGIAHGNIPVSAGAGLTASSVQQPSKHLIDDGSYAYIFSAIVDDIHATAQLFERRAAEKHEHQPSGEY